MSLLYLLSYISILIQISFLTLGIISGIYYLAELVEEYTVATKRIITHIICATCLIYGLFVFFDRLPWTMLVCGVAAQALHASILTTFPFVQFASVSFVGGVVLLVVNHWLALSFFAQNWHELSQVLAYFTLCLWPVPFLLLVSLCANDNVLPTTMSGAGAGGSGLAAGSSGSGLMNDDDVVTSYFSTRGKKIGILSLFNYVQDSVLPTRVKKSY